MAADAIPDAYQKIGFTPLDKVTDTLSSTPIGSATIPPATERLTYYRVNPTGANPA